MPLVTERARRWAVRSDASPVWSAHLREHRLNARAVTAWMRDIEVRIDLCDEQMPDRVRALAIQDLARDARLAAARIERWARDVADAHELRGDDG